MISSRHKYLLKHIKNRRLLLIVWDVLNDALTENTIAVAKQLYLNYSRHNIKSPDLVRAVAAWNPDYALLTVRHPELRVLINDMALELEQYKLKKWRTVSNVFIR